MSDEQINKSLRYGWFVCGLAAIFYCYEYLLRIQPSVMSSDLMAYYAINATAFGNLFAVYYYIYTPMQIPVGLMLDRYGPRILLTLACFICALGAFLFAFSQELYFAQAGRFLMGFGSAFAFVGVLKVAAIWLPRNRFAMVAGLATMLGMIGGMLGDNVMSLFVHQYGWRATVYGSAAIGVVLAFILWYFLHQQHTMHKEFKAQDAPTTFRELLKQVFILLSKRQMWIIAGIGGILYTSLSVFAELWGIPFLEQAKHFPRTEAAGAISMVFLGWAIGGPIVGYISDHFNNQRSPIIVGSIIGAVAITGVIYIPNLPISFTSLFLFFFGVAASTENITFAIAKDTIGAHLAGTAVAVTNMFVMLVGMILQPLVGKILDIYWDGTMINGVHHYSYDNFRSALLIIPALFIISFGLAWLLKKTYRVD